MSRIQGALPWDNAGARMLQGLNLNDPQASLRALGDNYANAYNNSLAMNQANYENVLAGYQDVAAQQNLGYKDLQGQYGQLYDAVLGRIGQLGHAGQQAIADQYAQLSGSTAQSMINRGLGNTTVQDSVQRGLQFDATKQYTGLQEQVAKLQADYMSQIGLAARGAEERGIGARTGLGVQQLDWMNSVTAAYPDAGAYGALAQQYGMMDQANRDRGALQSQAAQNMQLAMQAGQQTTPTRGVMMAGGGAGGGAPVQSVSRGGTRSTEPPRMSGATAGPLLQGAGGGTGPGTYAGQLAAAGVSYPSAGAVGGASGLQPVAGLGSVYGPPPVNPALAVDDIVGSFGGSFMGY